MKEVYAYVDEVGQRFVDLLKESTPRLHALEVTVIQKQIITYHPDGV